MSRCIIRSAWLRLRFLETVYRLGQENGLAFVHEQELIDMAEATPAEAKVMFPSGRSEMIGDCLTGYFFRRYQAHIRPSGSLRDACSAMLRGIRDVLSEDGWLLTEVTALAHTDPFLREVLATEHRECSRRLRHMAELYRARGELSLLDDSNVLHQAFRSMCGDLWFAICCEGRTVSDAALEQHVEGFVAKHAVLETTQLFEVT